MAWALAGHCMEGKHGCNDQGPYEGMDRDEEDKIPALLAVGLSAEVDIERTALVDPVGSLLEFYDQKN